MPGRERDGDRRGEEPDDREIPGHEANAGQRIHPICHAATIHLETLASQQ
jgi:hypothetical protein